MSWSARQQRHQLVDARGGAQERADRRGPGASRYRACSASARRIGGVAGREQRRVVDEPREQRVGGAHPPTLASARRGRVGGDSRTTRSSTGACDALLPPGRRGPAQAPHPVPPAGRQPLRRGADGRRGLLLRRLAALPPAPADRDRVQRGLRRARPSTVVPTTRSSRGTSRRTSSTARPRPPTRCSAASTCSPTPTYASPTPSPTSRRRCTATRSATSACTSRAASAVVETVFGALTVASRRLRRHPDVDHPPLGARRASCARW